MLKHAQMPQIPLTVFAAAFGRLCVETVAGGDGNERDKAAAFGRLCVETFRQYPKESEFLAAAFGRLCVETDLDAAQAFGAGCSRLRAAVC